MQAFFCHNSDRYAQHNIRLRNQQCAGMVSIIPRLF